MKCKSLKSLFHYYFPTGLRVVFGHIEFIGSKKSALSTTHSRVQGTTFQLVLLHKFTIYLTFATAITHRRIFSKPGTSGTQHHKSAVITANKSPENIEV
jgi:hypothetical protein